MVKAPPLDEGVLLGGPGASQALADQAPVFEPLLDRFGPARVTPGGAPFEALVSAIANQQLSVKAGATVYGRIETLCDGPVTPQAIQAASDEQLRACGLSRAKVGYVQDLAQRTLDGQLALDRLHELDDEAVVETLTQVKGIGRWTAQMVLIFDLHRPDILATGDLGVRDGARRVLELDERPSPAELETLAEPWRPYRSVACWYLWKERDRQLQAAGKR